MKTSLTTKEDRVPVLACEGLGRTWAHHASIRNVCLAVYPGDYLSIAGMSGAGKSTLLRVLGGLDRHYEGQLWLFEQQVEDLSERRLARLRNERIAYVFQSHQLLPHLRVWENILLPFAYGDRTRPRPHIDEVRALLEQLGIADKIDAFPETLSGGQQQRVAIARALMTRPHLLFCDELTGNLDRQTADEVMDVLDAYRQKHDAAIVVVSHDPLVLARATTHYLLRDGTLHPGKIDAEAAKEDLP